MFDHTLMGNSDKGEATDTKKWYKMSLYSSWRHRYKEGMGIRLKRGRKENVGGRRGGGKKTLTVGYFNCIILLNPPRSSIIIKMPT